MKNIFKIFDKCFEGKVSNLFVLQRYICKTNVIIQTILKTEIYVTKKICRINS